MEEEKYISFNCPNCGDSVDYLEQYAGTAQVCPFCAEDVVVPRSAGEPAMPLPLPIETSRLVLRRVSLEDFDDALAMLSDEETFQYDERGPLDEDDVKAWIDQAMAGKLCGPEGELRLAIALKTDQKLAGHVQLKYCDANRQQASLGVVIGASYRRKGFAFESLNAALQFAFCDISLHRVTVMCDSRNTPAIGLLTKLGMRKEAEHLRDRFVNGEWSDSLWFAILDEEFPCG